MRRERKNINIIINVDAEYGELLPYASLCQIMQACMEEGLKNHEKEGWRKQSMKTHLSRAELHRLTSIFYGNHIHKEDHTVNAFVRHGMALIIRDNLK